MIRPRLNKEQRNEVIEKYTQGIPIAHISRQFKVTRPTIYNVIESQGNTSHKKIDFYVDKLEKNKDMSTSEIKTNFLGVAIDTENGSNNPKIRKALDNSFKLLDIMEFVKITKFKLNMVMFDYFWQVVIGNHSTLIGSMVLEWFGYTGEYKKQRQNFKKMLSNNNICYDELTHKNIDHELYPIIQHELSGMSNCDIVKSKFLIMEPDDLKMAIMQLKTKNGHTIRQYYIDLEKLLKMYVEYTLYFNHRESQRKITNLEQMMGDMKLEREKDRQYMRSLGITLEEVRDQNDELLDNNRGLKKDVKEVKRKLGIAVKDRAPQPDDESKRERFVLIKRNDPEYYPYYTIRAQEGYTTRKLKFEKENFPNFEVLLDFKFNPNSKTLFNRIKENLRTKGVIFDRNNIDLEEAEIDEEKLIEEMKVINDQKLNIRI
ncbi:hypothetical protein WIV_gp104 [Wiseana iridescent virus]|uniref:Uncharacterized protein n=1 Tax=Wiseana iridescent virus TaxID=68347 RepID=G0T5D0_IRV9|nr:hypothetical protein WIV_gp104 [Wiseana iridescent virus]ADO00448.1 hypothetical protein [Wiseana iridescent virus]